MKHRAFLYAAAVLACAAVAIMFSICNNEPKTTPAGQCRLIIRCDTAVVNIEELDTAKAAYIPEDGLLLDVEKAVFYPGENAFDVLKRELTAKKMQFEYSKTPVSGGVYIEGISNLYEFDFGALSGWQFSVNDIFGSEDCSSYKVQNGDIIRFLYTCDLGRDIQGSIFQ